MTTIISSSMTLSKASLRPSTPIRRRHLSILQCNTLSSHLNLQQALLDLIDQVQRSTDSSTQLLIRLYHHKSPQLFDQPERLFLFQEEIYSGLRRLHPTIKLASLANEENQLINTPQPIVTCRSAQATIRKLH